MWRNLPPPPPRREPQLGNSFWRFGCSIWLLPTREAPNLVATLGGRVVGLFPKHRNIVFASFSLFTWLLADVLMLYSPLNMALLLVLLQPWGDGYFRLCSSKSSFRGTKPLLRSPQSALLLSTDNISAEDSEQSRTKADHSSTRGTVSSLLFSSWKVLLHTVYIFNIFNVDWG